MNLKYLDLKNTSPNMIAQISNCEEGVWGEKIAFTIFICGVIIQFSSRSGFIPKTQNTIY